MKDKLNLPKTEKVDLSVSIEAVNFCKWKGNTSLPANEVYTLTIDYPLSIPAKIEIKTGKKGLNTIDLIGEICKAYADVYDDEGKYGIWGHSISDLQLVEIKVNHTKKLITIGVDS